MFKPDTSAREHFQVEFDDQQLYKGEKAILFLNSTGLGIYRLADRYIGATPFKSMETGAKEGLEGLELQLANIVEFPDRDDRVNALKLLQGCDNLPPEITKRIVPLTTSTDPEIAFAALAVTVKSGTAADVERVRRYVRTYSKDAAPMSVVSLGSALGEVHDEKAWPALCDLSRSPLLSIRIGSMQALRRIRNAQAAACLVQGLDDSNSYVSYLSLVTLAETFEKYGDYAPNMELFDGNPRFYVNLWKTWWFEKGHNYATAPISK